jgi:hypothetical protein
VMYSLSVGTELLASGACFDVRQHYIGAVAVSSVDCPFSQSFPLYWLCDSLLRPFNLREGRYART